jgi:hypothetical protein
MHIETLSLTRVFDVQRIPSSRYIPRHTLFSFESNGQKHYSVQLPGWPSLEVGHNLAFVLEAEGNWQKVLGAKNLSTGEVTKPDILRSVSQAFIGAVLSGLFWLLAEDEKSATAKTLPVVLVCVCLTVTLALIVRALRQRKTSLLMKSL